MTREEEIKKQAEKKAHEPSSLMHPYAKQYKIMSAYEIDFIYEIGFIEGAEWADEHPKLVVIPPEEIENVAKYVIDKDWQAQKDKLWVMIERNLRAKFIDKACDWLTLQAQYVNIDGFRKAMKSSSSEIPNNSKKGGEK